VEEIMPLSGRTVLEYGSGNGAVTAAFAPRSARYIGIDIDADQVGAAKRLLANRQTEATLLAAPPEQILAETAAFLGEVDIFLCYAVLEHMTVEERLSLLELARGVLRDDGVIVVVETPNRLTPWDYHTSQLPFMNQLPEELALRYFHRSERTEFVEALEAAEDDAGLRETFARWGRGVSYHEFELVFGDLRRHVVASSWEPMLLPERNIYREELALQRVLDQARPDLPPLFSRYWLDLILTAQPFTQPRRFLRPWALRTTGSVSAAYDATEVVHLQANDAQLAVDLPSPSDRLVVGIHTADLGRLSVRQTATRTEEGAVIRGGGPEFADLRFPSRADRYEVALSAPGLVTFVGYEA
jgi:SAM-dependent methyltransferase